MAYREQIHRRHTVSKDILDAIVIREGNLTLVTLQNGDIPIGENHGYGLYYRDCRFLSGYMLSIMGQKPTRILSSDEKGFASVTMLTNPLMPDMGGMTVEKDTISIRRDRMLPGILDEKISVVNYNDRDVNVRLTLDFESDFDDIFTVRGITGKTEGQIMQPKYNGRSLFLSYLGADAHVRTARIDFDPPPSSINGGTCNFDLMLKPSLINTLDVHISLEETKPGVEYLPDRMPVDERIKSIKKSYAIIAECCSSIQTDNLVFNRIFLRSLADLRMLQMSYDGELFHSAGVPWYDALFGRDSIISALQLMPYETTIAKSTLGLLARYQGSKVCNWGDEEPGKILHELRVGEKANTNKIPQTPYYGSVDSTPLFLILMTEYVLWSGDLQMFHKMRENVDKAVEWIDACLNSDERGFVSYVPKSTFGLYNQGWKDSPDSVSKSSGAIARHPIALAEVQGYVYRAQNDISLLYDRIGERSLASRLRHDAEMLKRRFNEEFWMDDRQFYAQALDRSGQCDVISSNPVHGMWCDIIDKKRCHAVVDRIFQEDMFSGWGIRTLSSGEKRYNPLGYHTGTIWPHDNSIIGMGLSRYGYSKEMSLLFSSLYEAAAFYPRYRLPELFGGFTREEYDIPIKYPVACSPQAWSAGTTPFMLSASLGFSPDALNRRLTMYKPSLPPWLGTVRISGLKVGDTLTELEFRRVGESTLVNVVDKHGELDVYVIY